MKAGDLRGTTRIGWTGAAAIRLRVAKDVHIPESAIRLTVRRANFISVRAFLNPQPVGCRESGMAVCAVTMIEWFRDFEQSGGHIPGAPSLDRDYYAELTDPPTVFRGSWDLYLFTDGQAEIELKTAGLRGSAAYTAGGRVRGGAVFSRGTCIGSCSSVPVASGDTRFGGGTFRVGRNGYAESMAYGVIPIREVVPGAGANQPMLVRTCMYEARRSPAPDLGCDVAPPNADAVDDAAVGAVDEAGSPPPVRGRFERGAGTFSTSGDVYLGFRVWSAGPDRARVGGVGLAFNYGVF